MIVFSCDQFVFADCAMQLPIGCVTVRYHPDDFIARSAARAGEVSRIAVAHVRNMHRIL